jgi:hypothetical protein
VIKTFWKFSLFSPKILFSESINTSSGSNQIQALYFYFLTKTAMLHDNI